MKRHVPDFGDADVTSMFCDTCSSPVLVQYVSKSGVEEGDFCSRQCLQRAEAKKAQKVKISAVQKVKVVSSPQKVKISNRERLQVARRRAIRRIRNEILKTTGHNPTIALVQRRLTALGLGTSVRTIWKDLNAL